MMTHSRIDGVSFHAGLMILRWLMIDRGPSKEKQEVIRSRWSRCQNRRVKFSVRGFPSRFQPAQACSTVFSGDSVFDRLISDAR
jgi:hypothetical protein